MKKIDRAAKIEEVTLNFVAFEDALDDLLISHKGEYALIRSQKFVDFFSSSLNAHISASKRFPDGRYSIQKVANEPVNLGYYSYVDDHRAA